MRLLTFSLLAFCAMLPAFHAAPDPLPIGNAAPLAEERWSGVSGTRVSLAAAAGENGLLVLFTCNTCPYVKAWEDRYAPLAAQAKAAKIGMVAVNPNAGLRHEAESLAEMEARAVVAGYTFPYLVDAANRLADAFGATRTPEAFLFDGRLKFVYHGAVDDNARDAQGVEAPYLMDALAAVASGEQIRFKTTKSIGCTIKRLRN